MKNFLMAGAALGLLAACGPTEAPAKTETPIAPAATETTPVLSPLEVAVTNAARSEEEKARDVWRHPAETLEFFGVEPGDTVVEIWPGGGWYTNILGPRREQRTPC